MKNNRKIRIVISLHEFYEAGSAYELRNFLLENYKADMLFISHPLLLRKESYNFSSRYEYFKDSILIKKNNAFHWVLPEPFLYIKDFLYTLIWTIFIGQKYDLFFGYNPLDAFCGILLRSIGRVKKVVYYNIDFTPIRFQNKILDYIYHLFDKYAAYYADLNWVGTKRTIKARINYGLSLKRMAKTIIVPDGNHSLRIKQKKSSQVKKENIVYLGGIYKKQGIDLIIEALPKLNKLIKGLEFTVIGDGEYLDTLKEKVKSLKLNNVRFLGYIEDLFKVEDILTSSGIAVAPYLPDKNSFTYYSDPGKPKWYLACGLPVIITNVPAIAEVIERRKAGKMINYDKEELIKAVLEIMHKGNYEEYRKNSRKMGLSFDWSIIFKKALSQTLRI
ncbi:MAG: glycosyltransferase [Candidatus Levybacteria bacterium]|nr:glycosyltransferase [Candidatus Levybacteria bacterium]